MLSAQASDILAICVLAALGLSITGWVVWMLRGSPFSPAQSVVYALAYALTRVMWRVNIHGRFPIPSDQGAVVICNHRSSLDPSFIAMTVPRVVHWMVAREYCDFFLFRRLLRLCGSIPTNRGGVDTAATKAAIRIVENGGLVGLFPEGRINTTRQTLLPAHTGVAMIALKARAPVVPCWIHGAPYDGTALGCLLMPAAVRLEIGQPIDLSAYYDRAGDRELLDALTLRFLKAIAELGGDSDFQPQLARRSPKPTPQLSS
jgi:1-acyl-sn-glycerol-3-phosphate acyltransferase